MAKQPKRTAPRSFRFTPADLAAMDLIGLHLATERHTPHVSRTDVVRWALHFFLERNPNIANHLEQPPKKK
jgi:hypothetical protein